MGGRKKPLGYKVKCIESCSGSKHAPRIGRIYTVRKRYKKFLAWWLEFEGCPEGEGWREARFIPISEGPSVRRAELSHRRGTARGRR